MSKMFPSAGLLRYGYNREQVEEFFTTVRAAYERPEVDPNGLSPLEIRKAAFDLKMRGFKTADVDAALDRLEDAFAVRLRDQFIRARGQEGWHAFLAERAQVLYDRLRRPKGERFSRPKGVRRGYDTKPVDALLDRITQFFDTGAPVTPSDIRLAAFKRRANWRAYDERSVDAYLAKAVDILQGVS